MLRINLHNFLFLMTMPDDDDDDDDKNDDDHHDDDYDQSDDKSNLPFTSEVSNRLV